MSVNEMLLSTLPLGHPPQDWDIVHLKDVTSKIGSGATPRGGAKIYQSSGISLIRSQNVYDHKFTKDGLAYTDQLEADKLKNVIVKSGDVLLNITGDSIARCCLVPDWVLPARVNQHVAIIRPTKQLNSIFLQKYLSLSQVKDYILSHDAGATRKALTKGNIENFLIPLPPLPEQKAIASILSSLDDKIELNQQMNQTLEEIAIAIFKSWFVDFDPVRAKMEGKQPVGMDTATANLFPDSFEESELGLIPKGWRVETLSELAKLTSGKRPQERSSLATSEMNIPLYGGGGIMAYVKEPLYNYPILATGRVGTLGIVFRISQPCWTSDNTLVIISKSQEFYEYLYFQLKDIDIVSLNRGSTQPLVTQSDLKNQEFVIPSQELLKEFHFLTSSLFNKLDANIEQSKTLANTRDTLLPKLMSGEIRVKEGERIIEEVV